MNILLPFLFLLPVTLTKAYHQNCRQVLYFKGEFEKIFRLVTENVYPVFSVCMNETFNNDYNIAMEQYAEASEDQDCQDINFKRSKVNMVEMMHSQLVSVWEVANCQDCVDRRNATLEFFELFDQLDACIDINENDSLCELCAGNYSEVQSLYETLVKGHKKSICFDIHDRMNQTRHKWSSKYNCCRNKQHSKTAFIAFASVFCSLPVIFYLVMYLVTRRKEAREDLANGPLLNDTGDTDSDFVANSSTSVSGGLGYIDGTARNGVDSDSDEDVNFQPIFNNLRGTKQRNLADRTSNKPNAPKDVNISSNYKPKNIEQEEDDVSILAGIKSNVDSRNLLD